MHGKVRQPVTLLLIYFLATEENSVRLNHQTWNISLLPVRYMSW